MIELQLTNALALYSILLGALVAAIWVYTEFSVRRTHRVLEKQHLWRCVFCGYIYLDEGAGHVSECPRCNSFNSADDRHARFVRSKRAHSGAEDQAATEEPSRNTSHRKRPHQKTRGPRKRSRRR